MSEEDLKAEDKLILFIEYLKEIGVYGKVISRSMMGFMAFLLSRPEEWKWWAIYFPQSIKRYASNKIGDSIVFDWNKHTIHIVNDFSKNKLVGYINNNKDEQ